MLTERAKMVRRRTTTVSLQMTVISWLVEFVCGICILIPLCTPEYTNTVTNDVSIYILCVIIVLFHFIIIPCIHMLQTREFRLRVIENGWQSFVRISPGQANQVAPEGNNHIELLQNDNSSVETISRHVDQQNHQEEQRSGNPAANASNNDNSQADDYETINHENATASRPCQPQPTRHQPVLHSLQSSDPHPFPRNILSNNWI